MIADYNLFHYINGEIKKSPYTDFVGLLLVPNELFFFHRDGHFVKGCSIKRGTKIITGKFIFSSPDFPFPYLFLLFVTNAIHLFSRYY